MQLRLARPDRDTEHRRCFFVRIAIQPCEHQHATRPGRQRGDRRLDVQVAPASPVAGSATNSSMSSTGASTPVSRDGDVLREHGVDGDPVQPGPEPAASLEPRQRPPGCMNASWVQSSARSRFAVMRRHSPWTRPTCMRYSFSNATSEPALASATSARSSDRDARGRNRLRRKPRPRPHLGNPAPWAGAQSYPSPGGCLARCAAP